MFIRVKQHRRKGGRVARYAYLVRSKLLRRGPRQKVVAYLGRVVEGGLKGGNGGVGVGFGGMSFQEAVRSLVVAELKRCGFRERGEEVWVQERLKVDLKAGVVSECGRRVVLCVNDGFLCDATLKKVLQYQPPVGDELRVGRDLASWLLLAGLTVEKGVFLELLRKVWGGPTMPHDDP